MSRKYLISKLQELFIEDDHDQESFDDFHGGILKFYSFLSKYKHGKNRKGDFKKYPTPHKEDAYFAYGLGLGLLNLIGAKLNREEEYSN
jgi:hypothetical protein